MNNGKKKMKQSKIEYLAGLGINPIPDDVIICPHNSYCNVRKALELPFCLIDKTKDCQTYRFYEKWSNNYIDTKQGDIS